MEAGADPLLEAIASVVERLSDGGHCALIGLDDHGAATTVVAPSLPAALRDEFNRMMTEDSWSDATGLVAARHGYKSTWVTTAGTTVLALLYDGARPPGDDDSSLLTRFGPLVDVALAGRGCHPSRAHERKGGVPDNGADSHRRPLSKAGRPAGRCCHPAASCRCRTSAAR